MGKKFYVDFCIERCVFHSQVKLQEPLDLRARNPWNPYPKFKNKYVHIPFRICIIEKQIRIEDIILHVASHVKVGR